MTRKRHYTLNDVVAEMVIWAKDGCVGEHEMSCSDAEDERHPEDWCYRCLMGAAAELITEQLQAPPDETRYPRCPECGHTGCGGHLSKPAAPPEETP
jgi:hypothetical protein